MWRISAALVVLLTALVPSPAWASEDVEARTIRIVPDDGTLIEWRGQVYGGPIELRAFPDGITLVEEVTLDTYLLGIQEVPFSWDLEALRAQAVAARTYLAWTLSGGRRGSAATYGFDICATAACQVYRGLGQVLGPSGDRWQEAVESTATEVLLYNGSPAQTLYSSTMGSRTRNVEDVFIGSAPRPYLVAVDNPVEDSPFVTWGFDVPEAVMVEILREAGVSIDTLVSMEVRQAEDGDGPWMVDVFGLGDGVAVSRSFDSWRFRGIMNREGPDVAPDLLPALRPDSERRYPTVLLSPSYDVTRRLVFEEGGGFRIPEIVFRFSGEGWGHNIGMSQYGALALAEDGLGYDDILAYYYGGLSPAAGSSYLPETVEVGLAWGEEVLDLIVRGPATVFIDGLDVEQDFAGGWSFRSDQGRLTVSPPPGLGVPRDLADLAVPASGDLLLVTAFLTEPNEARLVVFDETGVIDSTPWLPEIGNVIYLYQPETRSLRFVIQTRAEGVQPAVETVR